MHLVSLALARSRAFLTSLRNSAGLRLCSIYGFACLLVLAGIFAFASCEYAFAAASTTASPEPIYLLGVPVDFILTN
jgi:hypothetical protein